MREVHPAFKSRSRRKSFDKQKRHSQRHLISSPKVVNFLLIDKKLFQFMTSQTDVKTFLFFNAIISSYISFQPISQIHKMVKHTQTIVGLALKRLTH